MSIIIAMYGVAPYIEKCLMSFVAQTYENIEIIAIDDGSLDDTKVIVERIQKEDRSRPLP